MCSLRTGGPASSARRDCGFVVHCGHRLPDEALYLHRPGTLRAG